MIIAMLCLSVLVCAGACFLITLKFKKESEAAKQAYLMHDNLTGLGNAARLLADYEAVRKRLDGRVLVSIELQRFTQFYSLFGDSIGNKVLQRFCQGVADFAALHGGAVYRMTFNRILLFVRTEDKDCFLTELQSFLAQMKQLQIEEAGCAYYYTYVLAYGVYFMSTAEDSEAGLRPILEHLDAVLQRQAIGSGAEFIIIDTANKPDWTLLENLTSEVRNAWNNREIVPYFQPVYDINTGKIVGSEILARWQHPTRGVLTPDKFIPVLEREGLMIDLDLYMLEEACKKIQSWLDRGILTVPLALNISKLNVHRADFQERFVKTVEKYDISPVLLELELPEKTLSFEENTKFIEFMNAMHQEGFSLGMDNFAQSDISALGLMRQMPFDIIKINHRFLENPDGSDRIDTYVRSFLKLAEELHIRIVVENIETEAQLALVKHFGCTRAKGYYFSKPLCNEAFEALID